MKRIIKIGVLMVVLTIGFNKTSNAVQQQCQTFTTFCGSGTYFTYTICGDNIDDIMDKLRRAEESLCGN